MPANPRLLLAGRYRLVNPLGQGGMGRVWLARDEVLRRDVAIKELMAPSGLTEGERRDLRERVMREARAIARLDQANVVRIFDVLQNGGEPWIVMEFVPSRPLDAVLAEDGPLAPAEAARIGLAVLSALRAAHQVGLLHRDVKPANVLLAHDGRVVLTDFGLALVFDDTSLTQSGIVLGSPSYISPERAIDGLESPAADLWSLGVLLYAAVEGRTPYERRTSVAVLAAVATELPEPPRQAGPLTPVLEGLLRKEPSRRIGIEEAEWLLRQVASRKPSDGAAPAPGATALPDATAQPDQAGSPSSPPPSASSPSASSPERPRARHRAAMWIPTVVSVLAVAFAGSLVLRKDSGASEATGAPSPPGGVIGAVASPSGTPPPNAAAKAPSGEASRKPGTTPTSRAAATSRARTSKASARGTAAPTGPTLVTVVERTARIYGIHDRCLDDESAKTADGNMVQLWDCEELQQQYWTHTATGTLQVFGRCLRAAGGGTVSGSLVELWTCDGGAEQRWQFDSTGHLVNRAAGLCLDDPSGGVDYGIQLDVAACRDAAGQHWRMP